jgi:hypothetical protein
VNSDLSAKTAAHDVIIAARALYLEGFRDFRVIGKSELEDAAHTSTLVEDAASNSAEQVSYDAPSVNEFRAAARSDSGVCFAIRYRQVESPGEATSYARSRKPICTVAAFVEADFSGDGWRD